MTNLPAIPRRNTPITADDVQRIELEVARMVREINDIEELEDWRLRAAALERYLRDKELQRPMLGAQRRVEARIGELLGDANEAQRSGEPLGHDLKVVRPDDRVDFRILAHAQNGTLEQPLTDDEWRKSRRALVKLVRRRGGLLPEVSPIPEGRYRVIVADPPWNQDTGPDVFHGTGERGHDALAYGTMSVENIKALAVGERAADDAHLYLWTTNRYLESSYTVARAWGFKPSVVLVWAKKPRGVGLGDAYRLTTEFCLHARRGSLPYTDIIPTTWFTWPRGQHSTKPDGFYELVEAMTPAPDGERDRLELFARRKRDGWTVWGDEVAR